MNESLLSIVTLFFVIVWVIGGLIITTVLLYKDFFKNKTFTIGDIFLLVPIFVIFVFSVLVGWVYISEFMEEDWINLKKLLYYLALSSPIIMLTTLWVLT